MTIDDFKKDIPLDLASRAHHGTSWVPEQRAQTEVMGYADMMAIYYEDFREQAEKGGTTEILGPAFEAYRAGVLKRTLAYLQSRTRFTSAFICGPSRYPAARMRRRHSVIERRLAELLEYRNNAARALRRRLRPDLAPVRSSDDDALDELERRIVGAQRAQELMKAANLAIRRHAKEGEAAQVFALAALGFGSDEARELVKPNFVGRVGFGLAGNNANIRRMKERVREISRRRATEARDVQGPAGVRLEEDPAGDRVRLFYPGKPEADTIQALRRAGFRWTPSLKCWQAYYSALDRARRFAGVGA